MTTKRMTKALVTGMMEATSGLMMRRSDGDVPKTRKMRSARATCTPGPEPGRGGSTPEGLNQGQSLRTLRRGESLDPTKQYRRALR